MRLRPFGALAFLPLSACRGWQSALDTHGPQARSLEILFWLFLAILGTVWVLAMVGLLARCGAAANRRPTLWRRIRVGNPE